MGTIVTVAVPDLGDFRDVEVIEALVAPGERIESGAPLITLESDKATLEVPSPQAGVVEEVAVAVGDRVSAGDAILTMTPETRTAGPVSADGVGASRPAHGSPSMRRLARELGVDARDVTGTGPRGRIRREDVARVAGDMRSPASAAGEGASALDFSGFGPVESVPLTRIQRLSGAHLARIWAQVPQVTQHDVADITDLEAFRGSLQGEDKADGARITLLGFLLKAAAAALAAFPRCNASLSADGENLVLKGYYHVGVAVDTPEGLVVPVIRDVDKKGIRALAEELALLTERARAGKISPDELKGGCFTISSLGALGGTGFTPIINAPEAAILGVGRSSLEPVYRDGALEPRRMLPLSLSYDHRIIDGAYGARFMNFLCWSLADVRRLLL